MKGNYLDNIAVTGYTPQTGNIVRGARLNKKRATKVIDRSTVEDGLVLAVRYHDTDVVTIKGTRIILNTGGWFTPTTRRRMNQVSDQYRLGYHVYQQKGKWLVGCWDKTGTQTLGFDDNFCEFPRTERK